MFCSFMKLNETRGCCSVLCHLTSCHIVYLSNGLKVKLLCEPAASHTLHNSVINQQHKKNLCCPAIVPHLLCKQNKLRLKASKDAPKSTVFCFRFFLFFFLVYFTHPLNKPVRLSSSLKLTLHLALELYKFLISHF